MESLEMSFRRRIAPLDGSDPEYVPQLVTAILDAARQARATDVHLVPGSEECAMRMRVDGVLEPAGRFPSAVAPRIVARLKVLARLLTYKTDIPQEGRLFADSGERADETRLSTFPTLFGEKAVIRLFDAAGRFSRLAELGLPPGVASTLESLLDQTGGVILITGPAGSGKTTTAYAAMRDLTDKTGGQRSLVSLEDPIEQVLPGVAQSQVNPQAGFDMTTGLKSLLRQDPEVILVGEIRDASTAETVFQASLTGHLVLTTFHAGSSARAVNRLSEMGLEPYLLRSSIAGILCQRLLRKVCRCATRTSDPAARLGLPVEEVSVAAGCDSCAGTGYSGRILLCEMLSPEPTDLGRAILSRSDAAQLEALAVAGGMTTQFERACEAVAQGLTTPVEVRRVLGTTT
jgi:type II secretory ATPase GspE/PulE/Tfp pilus assembly ATPase PilB-like protein